MAPIACVSSRSRMKVWIRSAFPQVLVEFQPLILFFEVNCVVEPCRVWYNLSVWHGRGGNARGPVQ